MSGGEPRRISTSRSETRRLTDSQVAVGQRDTGLPANVKAVMWARGPWIWRFLFRGPCKWWVSFWFPNKTPKGYPQKTKRPDGGFVQDYGMGHFRPEQSACDSNMIPQHLGCKFLHSGFWSCDSTNTGAQLETHSQLNQSSIDSQPTPPPTGDSLLTHSKLNLNQPRKQPPPPTT